jgi:iron(II)-dependent oxidoreductase
MAAWTSAYFRGQDATMTSTQLGDWVWDARERSCALVADLSDAQMIGPPLPIVNPLLWEIGHIGWFQEKWVLRQAAKRRSIRPDADALYDSAAILHQRRWDLALPDREQTLAYLRAVRDGVLEVLQQREPTAEVSYFTQLSVFHEDMHAEAFMYTRQTLTYPAPRSQVAASVRDGGPLPGDVQIPGGVFQLGATPEEQFVFDNEKWAHPVEVRPFAIARAAVTQAEFAAFVDDGGYRRQEFWSAEGWRWRTQTEAHHPVYWRQEASGQWLRRDFDQWVRLEPHRPVVHVNWHEATAYCRWAGRRLPTEVEWEVAAAGEADPSGTGLGGRKRRFPWGAAPPQRHRANLDGEVLGCLEVSSLADGDSAFGCRQMIGNVWEWTASAFGPYPGFRADAYKEYSAPWFGTHQVLRGGCWATRGRLLRNTWRNFYTPDRRDVWAGLRTCALTI